MLLLADSPLSNPQIMCRSSLCLFVFFSFGGEEKVARQMMNFRKSAADSREAAVRAKCKKETKKDTERAGKLRKRTV